MRYPDGKKTSRPLDFPSAFGKHRNLEVKFKHLGGSLSPHQAEIKIITKATTVIQKSEKEWTARTRPKRG
jgi:hypothetical protein